MSKAKLDGETRIQAYLSGLGLRPERFSKTEMNQGRTPDFRVFAEDRLAFYCEVKTAQKDEWLEKQLVGAPPLTLAVCDRTRPTTASATTSTAQWDSSTLC